MHEVPGYLLVRHVRWRLRVSGWDGVESSLIAVVTGLAGFMAVLGGADLSLCSRASSRHELRKAMARSEE
jgi:hypothetical protein